MELLQPIKRHRPILSFVAAAIAIVIAIVQDHVHLVITDPATWSDLYLHRCGLLLAAMVAWAMFEFLRSVGVWLRRAHPRRGRLRAYPR